MDVIVELNHLNNLTKICKLENVFGILIGINDISLTPANTFDIATLDKINKTCKKYNKKIILNAERLFNNEKLAHAKNFIRSNKDIFDYITYSDLGFLMMLKEEKMEDKAIYRAPTYLTNASDCNLYQKFNKYIVLSSEISSKELINLSKNLEKDAIVDAFGMNQCFYSRRKLITTYFDYRNMENDPHKRSYLIEEELRDFKQHIIEDETGTHIFEPKYSYLLEELKELEHVSMLLVHTIFLTEKEELYFATVYNDYINTLENEDNTCIKEEYQDMLYKGAYDIESVFLKGEKK